MTKKEQILDLFYNQHFKEVQIAEHLTVSQPYVSKVVKANKLYIEEMKNRKDINAEKRKVYLSDYHKNYTRNKKEDVVYQFLKAQHNMAVKELSFGNSLSDESYWEFNKNAFKYNSKKQRYELDKKLKTSIDIPKHISTKRRLRTQKYKKPCFI